MRSVDLVAKGEEMLLKIVRQSYSWTARENLDVEEQGR
jgi:hypothetical protein